MSEKKKKTVIWAAYIDYEGFVFGPVEVVRETERTWFVDRPELAGFAAKIEKKDKRFHATRNAALLSIVELCEKHVHMQKRKIQDAEKMLAKANAMLLAEPTAGRE